MLPSRHTDKGQVLSSPLAEGSSTPSHHTDKVQVLSISHVDKGQVLPSYHYDKGQVLLGPSRSYQSHASWASCAVNA